MTFEEWLDHGVEAGWVAEAPKFSGKSYVSCVTHDGVRYTEEEEAKIDEGYDPCVYVIRLLEERDV